MSFGEREMAILAADAFACGKGWATVDERKVTVAGEFDYALLPYRMLNDRPLEAAWDVRIAVEGGETYRLIVGRSDQRRYGTMCWEVYQPEQAEARP